MRRWAILPNIPHPLRVAAGVAHPARCCASQRQELCRRDLYQQSTMTAEELEAARRAMVELRAEHNAAAARAQGASPRRTCATLPPLALPAKSLITHSLRSGSGGRPQAGKLSAERAAVKRGGARCALRTELAVLAPPS